MTHFEALISSVSGFFNVIDNLYRGKNDGRNKRFNN